MLCELKSELRIKKEIEADHPDTELLSLPLTERINVVLPSTIFKPAIVIRLL